MVTALDVTGSGTEAAPDRRHLRGQRHRARPAAHRGPGLGRRRRHRQGLRPDLPRAPRREDRDPAQGADPQPRRPVDDLHAGRGPGLPGTGREPGRRAAADHQAQHRRGRDRRLGGARAGQHRRDPGAARHGGQGGAVQALRRDRRLPDLPRHPGRRRDRAGGRADRAGVRRHQPRGHLGAAVLRDRAAAARQARHPGLPRRPARHRHRGARRAAQRPQGGRQAPRGRPHRDVGGRRGGNGDPDGAARGRRPPRRRRRQGRRHPSRPRRACRRSWSRSPSGPTSTG